MNALTQAIAADNTSRNNLLMVAAGGLLSGLLTPLTPQLIDKFSGGSGNLRMALVAVPFAVLVFFVVRRCSANPVWAALLASIVTMVAFVCAVNAAIFIDAQAYGASKIMRNVLAGLAGGFVGAGVMALAIALLPAGPRDAALWMRMLLTGTLAGTLMAVDSALDLDLTSVLYPVWQAAVAVRLAMVLQRGTSA
ncbi:hypothetical protein [Bradyrhizobium sp. AUGA SZCCT0431]|uniref:hypothetical protein n=1 Tax=Bradyrhizobium sp. AUGA SZCCT0431 TaxID=2807674 RepID=UPI001BA7F980|nr:hypothetical protein [Bradyrhizobium sp. AUGA SZCCT0431]MBR1143598.1 hypothetical protein [Bradyrhizobium sp. AUGA SZCCT0431]